MDGDSGGDGLGGVDEGEVAAEAVEGVGEDVAQQGVVGAAEKEGGDGGELGEGFGEVDADDLAGDGVVDPALFDQRDEEGAALFDGADAEVGEGGGVGVGLDGGGGGEDEDLRGGGGREAGVGRVELIDDPLVAVDDVGGLLGAGLDDAEDGDGVGGGADVVEGEGGSGVAGDDEETGALLEEEAGARDGVAGDGVAGLGAVGEAGGVAEVEEGGGGELLAEGAEDGEAAEAGVKDADDEGGLGGGGDGRGSGGRAGLRGRCCVVCLVANGAGVRALLGCVQCNDALRRLSPPSRERWATDVWTDSGSWGDPGLGAPARCFARRGGSAGVRQRAGDSAFSVWEEGWDAGDCADHVGELFCAV